MVMAGNQDGIGAKDFNPTYYKHIGGGAADPNAIQKDKQALENNPTMKLYRSGGVIKGGSLRRSKKH